ncbi:MAG: UvrD-helicase domain-containing protein [Candidatus Coatesbacteria bacterium]
MRASLASLAVEASAGTGKTWLLVDRALWLILVRKVDVERIVALAFGEEAAAELRSRLRVQLERIRTAPTRDALDSGVQALAPGEPLGALQSTAAKALEALDRAHLSTIHSFASTLLRLFPAEARVDPGFDVVEDAGFADVIREEWSRFVAGELGESAPARERWLAVLARVKLGDLFELASALANYETDLEALPRGPVCSPESRRWLREVADTADAVLAEVPESRRKATQALAGFAAALREAADSGTEALHGRYEDIAAAAGMNRGDLPKDASPKTLSRLREVTLPAKALRAVRDEATIFEAVALLLPFARRARARLLEEGKLPYSGLLALARDLVRGHPGIRRALAGRFDAILLDEAQDVDPMQIELILYLAADPGREAPPECQAAAWRELRLVPGKLFVVGDPKQSIYGFRGADVRAFAAALDLMGAQGAERLALTTSMRSSPPVLAAVNAVGAHVFTPYAPLEEFPGRPGGPRAAGTEVLVVPPEAGRDPEAVEAEAVARRVAGLLASGLEPREIAVLFRKRSPMPAFQEAMRRSGIPVTIEAERRFFLRPEIMDLVNVVRVLADPADEAALLGVLRGPYAGLDDAAVDAWMRDDRRRVPRPDVFPDLRRQLRVLPPHEWMEVLFRALGVEAVASASADASARGAVRAFRRMLGEALATHGLPRTLELLAESLRAEADTRRRGAAPLRPPMVTGAETDGSVRFLTVHNAKGLEFPAVILAGIDARPQDARSTDTTVLRDWSGGTHGITLKAIRSEEAAATLDACRLKALRARSDREETGRLVYVALTRARDTLVIVDRGGGGKRRSGVPADTFRSFLAPLLTFPNAPIERTVSKFVRSGRAGGPDAARAIEALPVPPLRPLLYAEPELVTPSSLDDRARAGSDEGSRAAEGAWRPGSRHARAWLGELCHEVLRGWDFTGPVAPLEQSVELAAARLGGRRELPPALRQEALRVLGAFLRSDTAVRLGRARILGREMPLVAHVGGRTLSARADIVFAADGAIRIGDYKLTAASVPGAEVARTYVALADAVFGEACQFEVLPIE